MTTALHSHTTSGDVTEISRRTYVVRFFRIPQSHMTSFTAVPNLLNSTLMTPFYTGVLSLTTSLSQLEQAVDLVSSD